jgi:predicted SAM-dependent methyltransferase
MAQTQPKVRVVVGASGVFEDDWIATDIEYMNLLNKTHWKKCFKDNRIDAVLAEHVWEHLSREEGLIAAKYCFDHLKTGGYLRIAVPDGLHPSQEYISHVKVGADGHKELYDYKSFVELFEDAGFEVKLLEYYDSDGEFHFQEWDAKEGKIHRSKRFDKRECNYKYTSLIIDAIKR